MTSLVVLSILSLSNVMVIECAAFKFQMLTKYLLFVKYICKNILPEMRVKFDNYWLVNSEKDINIKYKVEKTYSSCSFECVLRCDMCHICIHSYKCTCLNNLINYNICKHIHACATSEPNQILNFESKVPVMM